MFQAEPPSTRSARTSVYCTRGPVLLGKGRRWFTVHCSIVWQNMSGYATCVQCSDIVDAMVQSYFHKNRQCMPCFGTMLHLYVQDHGLVWCDMSWYGLVLLLCLILLWILEFGFVWFGIAWFGIAWVGIAWYDMVWYGLVLPGIIWPGMVKEPRAALNSTSSRRKRWLNLFKKGVKSICTLLPSSLCCQFPKISLSD